MEMFENTADITVDNLNFHPIIAQSETYIYNTAQVSANYVKPLCSNNDYIIQNTQEFAKIISEQDLFLMLWSHCSPMLQSTKQWNPL